MSSTNASQVLNPEVEVHGLFIDGVEVPASRSDLIDVINPATGDMLAQIAHASDNDVDRAVRSAAAAFESPEWANMSNRTRARLINKLADVMETNIEQFYRLETLNNGRSLNETRAQVSRLPDFLRYNAGLAIARRDSVIPVDGNYLNYTIRTPVGVVGNSTPFNHPLMILMKSLAPVLASGCATVVKPSEYTPLTTLLLAKMFVEAGLPPGVFNIVTGLGPTTGKALAEHRLLDKWVLTGGTEAGRITGAVAGSNFAHQTLELGGKTPVLVFDDFDVDQAVNYAAFGAFIGAGQTCICGSRQIVHERVYDEFVEKLAAKAKSIRIGNPIDPSVQLGPVVSARQQQRVLNYIRIGLEEDGARLVAGGKVPTDPSLANGFFVQPTVFADVTAKMRIFQEEVFGPFVSISKFSTEAEAIAMANDCQFGLAGAVRTNDITRAHRVAARLKCGIVWVNDHHRLDPASPWGGVKDSGIGRECGTESFDQHFETKSVMVRLDDAPFDWYKDTATQPRLN
jgi:acyl-CoA reductase-like NAD-dependent aldehyde dehydrogenase